MLTSNGQNRDLKALREMPRSQNTLKQLEPRESRHSYSEGRPGKPRALVHCIQHLFIDRYARWTSM